MMHVTNQMLPSSVIGSIEAEATKSLSDVTDGVQSLEIFLESSDLVLDDALFTKFNRLITNHLSLLHKLPVGMKSKIMRLLMSLYSTKTITLPLKSKILDRIKSLVKRRDETLSFELPWKALFEECLSLALRLKKFESIASDDVNANYLKKMFEVLHKCRRYVSKEDAKEVLHLAMEKLRDIRSPHCVQGLLLIMNCLPTDIGEETYDSLLPEWVSIWSSIEHNVHWDIGWLTLLARARKNSRSFDWLQLSGTFLAKAKQLLQLVTLSGEEGSQFPQVIPGYYSHFIAPAEGVKVALKKLAKLMYFLVCIDPRPLVMGDPISITPIQLPDGVICPQIPGFNVPGLTRPQTVEISLFLQSIRTYFYPSNTGAWTSQIAFFVTSLISQMGKHMGYSIAKKLLPSSESKTIVPAFELPTSRFIIGTCLSIILEGLYGKSNVMMQYFALAIKNIVSYDPTFGNIILPVFLTALDPAAVNQSHQAPAVLHTLTLCFKPLMYPQPVILPYLPEIMKLSLPGLDPSDSNKSQVALKMFSMILSWIPIKTSYTAPTETSAPYWLDYLDIITTGAKKGTFESIGVPPTRDLFQAQLDDLAAFWSDWIPQFWDKIVALLESQEVIQKHTRPSPLTPLICECVAYLFQCLNTNGMDREKDIALFDSLRANLDDRVFQFFKKTSNFNVVKTAAKIVDSMVSTNPSLLLPKLVHEYLDEDVLNLVCSSEKLVFRLRLVGGACRNATGEAIVPVLDRIQLVINNPKFIGHTEKTVRKATFKLVKDVLKGMTASYMVDITPQLGNTLLEDGTGGHGGIFCSPSSVGSAAVTTKSWYTPKAGSVVAGIALLRVHVTQSMSNINELLVAESQESNNKKVEESIHNYLKLIQKALRGSAEILGDDLTVSGDRMDVATAAIGADDVYSVPVTGREFTLQQLTSDSDREYLLTLRHTVMTFLLSLAEKLSLRNNSADENKSLLLTALSESPSLLKAWMKIFKILVTQRMAYLKNVDAARSWVGMTIQVCTPVIIRTIRSYIKRNPNISKSYEDTQPGVSRLSSTNYWLGHELSTNTVSNKAYIQYIHRINLMGALSMKQALAQNGSYFAQGRSVFACLRKLVLLCGHEYDSIRPKAQKTFGKIAGKFGWTLNSVIVEVIDSIEMKANDAGDANDAKNRYAELAGKLGILQKSMIMKRIVSNWELLEPFLLHIGNSTSLLSTITDAEKREKLNRHIVDTFLNYIQTWYHIPIPSGSTIDKIFGNALVGLKVTSDGSGPTGSLRHDCIHAYTILHFIGHSGIPISSVDQRIWQWAVSTVSSSHGQPVQPLALAVLTRLSYQLYATPTGMSGFSAADRSAMTLQVRKSFNNQNQNQEVTFWQSFFYGISQSHPRVSDDGSAAQWSRGIDSILQSAHTVSQLLPRNLFSDSCSFSHKFKKIHAGLFLSLVENGVFGSGDDIIDQSLLKAALVASKSIPSASEEEDKVNNATRAALFAGLFRGARFLHRKALISSSLWQLVEKELFEYFQSSVKDASKDYITSWAEGLVFALGEFSSTVDDLSGRLVAFIIEEFKSALSVQSSSNSGTGNNSSSSSSSGGDEEGFTKAYKALLVIRAVVSADVTASTVEQLPRGQSYLSQLILDYLNDPTASVIVSSFQNVRLEISNLIGTLHANSSPMQDIHFVTLTERLVQLHASATCALTQTEETSSATPLTEETTLFYQNQSKYAIGVAVGWLNVLLRSLTQINVIGEEISTQVVGPLFRLVLLGSGHTELDFAKLCHGMSLRIIYSFTVTVREKLPSLTTPGRDIVASLMSSLQQLSTSESWHVRETIALGMRFFVSINWSMLSESERKQSKDLILEMLFDVKPEVQALAMRCMVLYLTTKPLTEMKTISGAYTRNCDSIATREAKKRKALKDSEVGAVPSGGSVRLDRPYWSTVYMSCCIIQCFPYDLPEYLPSLIAALVKHVRNPELQGLITRVIQDFKRTHQDQWTSFVKFFTLEQLDSLQGTGAAHYFA